MCRERFIGLRILDTHEFETRSECVEFVDIALFLVFFFFGHFGLCLKGFVEVAANRFRTTRNHIACSRDFGSGERFFGEQFLELGRGLVECFCVFWLQRLLLIAGIIGVFGANIADLIADADFEIAVFFAIDVDFIGFAKRADIVLIFAWSRADA